MMVDVIYVAASARDARFTRICVASVRYFYPDITIKLLVGGPLQAGLRDELARYWNVGVADLPARNYGWGFVKLEPLFGAPGERFLVLDSDTVITGPVLDWAAKYDDDFLVDDEDQSPAQVKAIYYDTVAAAEEGLALAEPDFVFNTGQVFARSGILRREDFDTIVAWGSPPTLKRPRVFKNGEQGALNFVLNEQVRAGRVRVARVRLMHWPGHGVEGLDVDRIERRQGEPLVVHWAGMKKARLRDMKAADLLTFFEKMYYRRLPGGELSRTIASWRHVSAHWLHYIALRVRLFVRRISSRLAARDR